MRYRSYLSLTIAILLAVALVGCSGGGADDDQVTTSALADTEEVATGLFDTSTVHTVSVTFDEDDYAELVATYAETGEKTWIEATVTIDGITYEQVGMRLKGNSSLRSVGSGDEDPEELPWLIKLDEYIGGQDHEGIEEFAVRSNNSTTALNEAVAQDILAAAGLASEDASWITFDVNGSEAVLRLVVENPDDEWVEDTFANDGALYKAKATGDYTYRGNDPDAYDEEFDQEAGDDVADLTPLIDFLEFINEADDDTFAAELSEWMDVEAFATYLAANELVDNFDDIDGPGNNSYLWWDAETGLMTVVPWDYNLAFGAGPRGRNGPGGVAGGQDGQFSPPDDVPLRNGDGPPARRGDGEDAPAPGGDGEMTPPFGHGGPDGAPGEGGPGMGNVLSDRFLEVDEFAAMVDAELQRLTNDLIDSGLGAELLEARVDVLADSGLVDPDVLEEESAAIAEYLQ
ncbi:MAG: CotH kinase family protein [Nitriliruptorales bacterium]|nr:CotH kinase family protein [Nitriliruptorales bacterium]